MPNHKIVAIDNLSLQELDSEAELIPLMTPEDEEEMNNDNFIASKAAAPVLLKIKIKQINNKTTLPTYPKENPLALKPSCCSVKAMSDK